MVADSQKLTNFGMGKKKTKEIIRTTKVSERHLYKAKETHIIYLIITQSKNDVYDDHQHVFLKRNYF